MRCASAADFVLEGLHAPAHQPSGRFSEAIRIADLSVLLDNSELGYQKILEARRGVVLWTAPQLPDWARRVLSDLESSKAQQA
jgi:hypothetical protein